MSTKELQENLKDKMAKWQQIEDASVASTAQIISKTKNPLIRQIMEIILQDSKQHYRVQRFIRDSLEMAYSLNPDELGDIWGAIEEHLALEKRMVGFVEEALDSLKGKKMLVVEYLLNYLKADEAKHDKLLEDLSAIKKGMYPYG